MADDKLKPVAEIEHLLGEYLQTNYSVRVTYPAAGVDRPSTYSCSTAQDLELAQRLAKAITDGVAITEQRIKTDVNGNTYVRHTCNFMGRYLNKSLVELGY